MMPVHRHQGYIIHSHITGRASILHRHPSPITKPHDQYFKKLWNGMKYVIWVKDPALGPGRSFSANRREKRNKIGREESIQQN